VTRQNHGDVAWFRNIKISQAGLARRLNLRTEMPAAIPGTPPALLYGIEAPVKAAALPVGEFNRSHLAAGQPRRALVNGVRMEARWSVAPHIYELLSKQPKKLCPVTLQNHVSAPAGRDW